MPARKKADMAFLAEILKRTGVDADPDVEALKEARTEYSRIQLAESTRARQQSGVFRQLHHLHSMEMKACLNCKRPFKTSYCYEVFCTDECREKAFELRYGISWDQLRSGMIHRTPSEWHYEPVLGVTPDIIDELEVWARKFLEDLDEIRNQVVQQAIRPTESTDNLSRTEQILRKIEGEAGLTDESMRDNLHTDSRLEDAKASQNLVQHTPKSDPFDLDFSEFSVEPFQ